MEPMTPEERFTKIENAIERLNRNASSAQCRNPRFDRCQPHAPGIAENTGGISEDVESQKKVTEQIGHLTEKIDRLTANIDKLIHGRGPNGQA
jgi:Na+-translocating ferredoxin:NAD+ oxidoreductase RNF subunit RnfB